MPPATPSSGSGETLMAASIYYLPRLMFLNARYAPQTHWGDIAAVLRGFPSDVREAGSEPFWDAWRDGWTAHGDRYEELARTSTTTAGRIRAARGAAVSYHWAEFMDFGDPVRKLSLRSRVRDAFERSLKGGELDVTHGELALGSVDGLNGCGVPYWLVMPPGQPGAAEPYPCVILSNGLDSMTEVEIFALAEPYLERGIAALLFDGPGQGIHVGQSPLLIEFETLVTARVDVLRADPRIADDRLSFTGVSFGGYFALRLAQRVGSLFRCIVNLSGGPAVAPFDGLPRRLKDDFRMVLACGEPVDMQARFDGFALDPADPPGAPVLTVHGGRDDIFPLAGLRELDRRWGSAHQTVVYEQEKHIAPNYVNIWSLQTADWTAGHLMPDGQR